MKRIVLALLIFGMFAVAGCGSSNHSYTAKHVTKSKHYVHEYTAQELFKREATKNEAPKTLVHLHRHGVGATPRTLIPAAPLGPAGAFHRVYGDSFAATIGSGAGQDSGWKGNNHDQGCCNNSDERAAERENEVRISEAGAEVNCDHIANAGHSYTCGGMDTDTPNGFKFEYSPGITFAVQTRMKVPPASNCGEDPGWWASDPSWTDEFDFFEFWGWNPACKYSGGIVWIYKTPSSSTRQQCEPWEGCGTWVPNPDGEYKTYTTVVNGTGTFEEWIDGKWRKTVGGASANTPWEHLIFTHALREASGSTPPRFTSTSTFHIDYVAVYEIGSGHTIHAGLAPGTHEVGEPGTGTEKVPPPPVTTEEAKPPPTTETTPPPPPPTAPAVPTGCKAEGFTEGTTPKTRASCNTPPAGVSIEWQRTGPWTCSAGATPRYPIWTTGNPISNACAVEHGKRYDWSARAHNSTGTSAWTTPLPAYTP